MYTDLQQALFGKEALRKQTLQKNKRFQDLKQNNNFSETKQQTDNTLNKQTENRLKSQTIQSNINYLFENEQYDPDESPPDIRKAIKHGKAQRVCKDIDYTKYVKNKCECCGKAIDNELLSMCDHPNNLQHLGTTYPLYFVFIKQCFIMIAIHMCIQAIPSLIIYQKGTFCERVNENSLICKYSFVNIMDTEDQKLLNWVATYNFIAIIFMFFLIEIFKIYQQKRTNLFEKDRKSVQYYSIILKKVPPQVSIRQIEKFLDRSVQGSSQDIKRIFILYDLKEYEKALKERKEEVDLINQLKLELKQVPLNQKYSDTQIKSALSLLSKRVEIELKFKEQLENKLQNLQQQLVQKTSENVKNQSIEKSQQAHHNLKFSGRIIITFQTHATTKKVKKYFKKSSYENLIKSFSPLFTQKYLKQKLKRFYINDQQIIRIKEAPEPSDILWTGLGATNSKQKIRILSNIFIIISMLSSLAVIVTLKIIIRKSSSGYSAFWKYVFNLVAALVVALANVSIGIIIRKMASKEQRTTQTSYFIQVGQKLTQMFLVNMILTIFFANLLANILLPEEQNELLNVPIDLINLIGEYFFLFITNSYISSIMSIFDIVYGFRLFQRYILQRNIRKTNCWASQQDANSIFEGHPIDMALRYANVLKVVLYTLAISVVLPIGPPMCLLGLIIIYWADKFLIYRRMVCNNYISKELAKKMNKMLHLSPILFATGNIGTFALLIYNQFDGDFNQQTLGLIFVLISIIGLLIALILYLFPSKKASIFYIYMKFNKNKYIKPDIKETFDQLKKTVIDDYDLYHPATRDAKLTEIKKQKELSSIDETESSLEYNQDQSSIMSSSLNQSEAYINWNNAKRTPDQFSNINKSQNQIQSNQQQEIELQNYNFQNFNTHISNKLIIQNSNNNNNTDSLDEKQNYLSQGTIYKSFQGQDACDFQQKLHFSNNNQINNTNNNLNTSLNTSTSEISKKPLNAPLLYKDKQDSVYDYKNQNKQNQ